MAPLLVWCAKDIDQLLRRHILSFVTKIHDPEARSFYTGEQISLKSSREREMGFTCFSQPASLIACARA